MEQPVVPANFDAEDKWSELDALIDKAHDYARANGIALTTYATARRSLEDTGASFAERASTYAQSSNLYQHGSKYLLMAFLDNALDHYPEALNTRESLQSLLGAVRMALETKQEEICAGTLPYDPVVYGQKPSVTH